MRRSRAVAAAVVAVMAMVFVQVPGSAATPPVVTSVSPAVLPPSGGSVTLTGLGFSAVDTVRYGALSVTNHPCAAPPATSCFTATTDASMVMRLPALAGQSNDLVVSTAGTASTTGDSDVVAILGLPAISGITPSQGYNSGGVTVTLVGANLSGPGVGPAEVDFGTARVRARGNPDGSVTASAPPGATGTVDVRVVTMTDDGSVSAKSAAGQARFTYLGMAPAASPSGLGPPPQVRDLGRYNAGTASPNHWVTTGGVSTAYTGSPGAEEFSIGLLRSDAASGFSALFGCQAGTFHFVSLDPGCEGQQFLRTEGFTSSTASSPYTLRIYRCRAVSNNDHFVSTSSTCEGQAGEGSLGFIEPRSGLGRFVVPGRHWTADGSVAMGYQPEGVLGYVASVGGSGAPLYECVMGTDHFTSRDPGCEGQHRYTFLGWISAAGSSQPLYRCFKNGAHFDTTSSTCEGLGPYEAVLGNLFTAP
jgi:hypothetical protein